MFSRDYTTPISEERALGGLQEQHVAASTDGIMALPPNTYSRAQLGWGNNQYIEIVSRSSHVSTPRYMPQISKFIGNPLTPLLPGYVFNRLTQPQSGKSTLWEVTRNRTWLHRLTRWNHPLPGAASKTELSALSKSH